MGSITLSTAWAWLLAGCAGVVTLSKAIEILKKVFSKGNMTEKLDRDNRRINALEEESKEQKETNRVLLRALLAIVNHEIDGNGIEGLKQTRTELTDYLTKN